jgi:transposase-like protein
MRTRRRPRRASAVRSAFAGFRFPADVIVLAVRWYLRFGLSSRDLEELLTERGVEVDHVTIYRWVQRFTLLLADAARPCRHAVGDRWQVDETYVKVAGRWRYVYRAIDQFGQVIDVFVSLRRDAGAARRFFQRAIGATRVTPAEVTTDQARLYPAVLEELLPAAWHRTDRYANTASSATTAASRRDCGRCAGSSRTVAPGLSSLGMRSSKTFDVDTTSWLWTRQRIGGWRSRSTSWPRRSDPGPRSAPSAHPWSAQRNSAGDCPGELPAQHPRPTFGHPHLRRLERGLTLPSRVQC